MRAATSHYAGVHHDSEAPIDVTNNGVFFLNSRVTYEDLSDGSSQTIFFGEKFVEANDLGWMSGTNATLRNAGLAINAGLAAQRTGTNRFTGLPGLPDDVNTGGVPGVPLGPGVPFVPRPAPVTPIPRLNSEAEPSEVPRLPLAEPGAPKPADLVVGGFGSHHAGGALFAMGDGSVRFLSQAINFTTFQQLAHRRDGLMLGGSY